MAKKWRLGFDGQAADALAPFVHFEDCFHNVIDVALRVDAPWDGEAQQFVFCVPSKHHRADLHRTDACVAVGTYYNGVASQTLAEQWDGSVWSTVTTTNPSASDYFNGVSCTSASVCVAVGTYDNGSVRQALAELYNNSIGISI